LPRRAGAEIIAQHEKTDLLLGAAIRPEHAVEASLEVLREAQLHAPAHGNQMIRIAPLPLDGVVVEWLSVKTVNRGGLPRFKRGSRDGDARHAGEALQGIGCGATHRQRAGTER
jgi:hypothetical protein